MASHVPLRYAPCRHADLRRRVDAAGRKLQGLEAQGDPMARRAGLVAQLSRAVAAHLAKVGTGTAEE